MVLVVRNPIEVLQLGLARGALSAVAAVVSTVAAATAVVIVVVVVVNYEVLDGLCAGTRCAKTW